MFAHRLPTPASAPAACCGTDRLQEPVESGCAGSQQPVSYLGIKIEMAMALHGVHHVGQRRFQAFSANTVGSFPDHDHRFPDGLIVNAPAFHQTCCIFVVVKIPDQPDAVLAMVSGDRDELVEDPALVLFGRAPVWKSTGNGLVVLPIVLVLPPCLCLYPRGCLRIFGSILCEAMRWRPCRGSGTA